MKTADRPIASCPANEVDVYEYPFYVKKGVGVEADFLMMEMHLFHMTDEEKAVMGKLTRVENLEDLESLGYPRDDRGVFIIE